MEQKLETRTQTVQMGADGICRATCRAVYTDIDDIKEDIVSIGHVAGGEMVPVLVDIRACKGISREARAYLAGEDTAKVQNAAALLVESTVTRVMANFFLGLNKPLFPTKMFNEEPKALTWLSEFVVHGR